MNSLSMRANAIGTFSITVLAVLCAVASVTDLLHASNPQVDLKVASYDNFYRQHNGNDEVRLTLNVTADLQSIFTWNTKQLFVFVAAEYETPTNVLNQVSLWDAIIESPEQAKFSLMTRNKYSFVDQGNNLRNKNFNLTMYWNVMPLTGAMFSDKRTVSGFRLPKAYK